jgi:hypothetical protein
MIEGNSEGRTPSAANVPNAPKHVSTPSALNPQSPDSTRRLASTSSQMPITTGPRPPSALKPSNHPFQPIASVVHSSDATVESAARSLQQFSTPRPTSQPEVTQETTASQQAGADEEAVVYSQTRMLQDPTGRLCKCSKNAYYLYSAYSDCSICRRLRYAILSSTNQDDGRNCMWAITIHN